MKKVRYSNEDRISELSDSIIYHIQSLLPSKDAARMCILSKYWNQICSLYPVLYLDHKYLTSSDDDNKFISIDSYLDIVDNRLLGVQHDENQSFRMLGVSFSFCLADIDKYSSRVDQWMELITQSPFHVYELSFSVSVSIEILRSRDQSYDLKLPILFTKGLRILSLKGCTIKDCYTSSHNTNITSSLRHLSLFDVSFTQDAWDTLASCCLSIETIEVKHCYTLFKRLSLSNFSKSLKKANLGYISGSKRVILTGTNNLTSLTHECYPPCKVDVAAFSGIKQLSLETCHLYVRGQIDLFPNFTAIFPVIEEAYISLEYVKTGFGSKFLKVASHYNLKTLYFSIESKFEKAYITDCPNLKRLEFGLGPRKELHIDCPNLRHFYYYGSSVPSLFFKASTHIEYLKWVFSNLRLDNFWFVKLRKFVKQMSGYTFDLRLFIEEVMDSPTSKENQGGEDEPFTKESDINLELVLVGDKIENQACLLNWSLWSTCPSTLCVWGNAYDLLKELCDKLSKRYDDEDQDQDCKDKSLCNKHWWHHVKDFEVECPRLQIQDIKGNLPTLLEFHKTDKCNFTFRFHWSFNDIS